MSFLWSGSLRPSLTDFPERSIGCWYVERIYNYVILKIMVNIFDHLHIWSPVEHLTESLSHRSHRRQATPANSHWTRSGHSVTLTNTFHARSNGLYHIIYPYQYKIIRINSNSSVYLYCESDCKDRHCKLYSPDGQLRCCANWWYLRNSYCFPGCLQIFVKILLRSWCPVKYYRRAD